MAEAKTKSKAETTKPRGKPDAPVAPQRADPRLKKIYVYSEGTFVLHNAAEVHKIAIKTPAFDVAGWIDLSKMAPGGDRLFTEVRVSFANRANVLYQRTVFEGPRLITLGDITNGNSYMSGTHIEFWFQQDLSHDNYAKPVEYAYQFVVESQ
jgi:hypothetical protein